MDGTVYEWSNSTYSMWQLHGFSTCLFVANCQVVYLCIHVAPDSSMKIKPAPGERNPQQHDMGGC